MKTTIATVKNEFRLTEWSAQIQAQKSSGLTVHKWCEENGVKVKTYYYHLRKVREKCIETAPAIVPLTVPNLNDSIHIVKMTCRYLCQQTSLLMFCILW